MFGENSRNEKRVRNQKRRGNNQEQSTVTEQPVRTPSVRGMTVDEARKLAATLPIERWLPRNPDQTSAGRNPAYEAVIAKLRTAFPKDGDNVNSTLGFLTAAADTALITAGVAPRVGSPEERQCVAFNNATGNWPGAERAMILAKAFAALPMEFSRERLVEAGVLRKSAKGGVFANNNKAGAEALRDMLEEVSAKAIAKVAEYPDKADRLRKAADKFAEAARQLTLDISALAAKVAQAQQAKANRKAQSGQQSDGGNEQKPAATSEVDELLGTAGSES